ncbi:MAG: MFS transporter [Firmicutes bacterium]|nr:MFS transporter [Bacillota bacterium]
MRVLVSEVIDGIGVSRYTWLIFILCGFAMLFDGYDNMIVAYTMPQISKEWALTKVQTGSLVSWGLLGLLFGGFCAGVLSDAIGRKKTLILSCVVYSIFCGLIYFAQSFEMFALFRVLSGFGLGACLPVSITIVSESVPTKNRGLFITSLFAFFLAGWVLAGVVAMFVIPVLGWRICYLLGMLPAIYAILLAIQLPESSRWLLIKGREAEAVAIIQRLEKSAKGVATDWPAGSIFVPPPPKVVGPAALFSRQFLPVTIGLSLLYFMGTMIVYGVSGWLPSLLVAKGYSMVKSYSFAIMQNSASMVANVVTGFVSDRIGRKKTLYIGFIILGITVILLGYSANQFQLIVFSILVGFFSNFALTGVQPLLAESYPTEFRNTGVAYSQAFGRLGGMAGPLLAGFVQTIGFGFTGTLAMFAAPAIICVIILYFFRLETRGKSLEAISSELTAKA